MAMGAPSSAAEARKSASPRPRLPSARHQVQLVALLGGVLPDESHLVDPGADGLAVGAGGGPNRVVALGTP